tara:strand:- start:11094 stop:11756 length:663 start_codon:yes stop_codon:yes gene_type:complete
VAGVLKKLAKEGIENASDFLKSFRKKTYYHVSPNPDIEKFEVDYPSSFGDRATRGAIYFTSDPTYAEDILEELEEARYSFDELGDKEFEPYTTYPVKIKKGKIFDFTNKKQMEKLETNLRSAFSKKNYRDYAWLQYVNEIGEGNYKYLEDPDVQKVLKKLGFRGYKTSEPGTVGLFYPEDVRSIFGKFNPEDAKSGNILKAVVPVGGLNLLGATNGESEN